jgi:membrane-associated phospholipid phosphatase
VDGVPGLMAKVRASLSLRVVLVLGAATLAAVALVWITGMVVRNQAGPLDLAVIHAIRRLDSPVCDVLMRGVTVLGDPPALLLVVVLVGGWALRRRRRSVAGVLILAAVLAQGLNHLFKIALRRRRPQLFVEIVAPMTFSFPSGHAMLSAAIYGMAALVVARLAPALRKPLAVFTPLLVLVVGSSRVYLGVHWPTDVLAGFAGGSLIVIGGAIALHLGERGRSD